MGGEGCLHGDAAWLNKEATRHEDVAIHEGLFFLVLTGGLDDTFSIFTLVRDLVLNDGALSAAITRPN